jgi:hypothetical protein
MTKEHWHSVESMLEDIVSELDSFEEAVPAKYHDNVQSCTDAVHILADAIYGVCEEDYCDSCDDLDLAGYDEVLALLPPGETLSLEEIQRLVVHIQNWKRGL